MEANQFQTAIMHFSLGSYQTALNAISGEGVVSYLAKGALLMNLG